ncbi:MAG TPA: SDR family NAD(P)-dependent oxidoreductase, partial [Chthonomonadaceae bacterium]|nr:SDR family NAD(P)-dependent oxidoreductase [Chthonomonadaceae bacterium]
MQIDLTGKVAIVTGAGRGIGRVIVETLVGEGVTTFAIDIQEETLHTLQQDYARNGWQGEAVRCDVRRREEIRTLVDRIVARQGRIDILVNNAGVSVGGTLETLSEEAWDANLDTNLKGTFLMCQ